PPPLKKSRQRWVRCSTRSISSQDLDGPGLDDRLYQAAEARARAAIAAAEASLPARYPPHRPDPVSIADLGRRKPHKPCTLIAPDLPASIAKGLSRRRDTGCRV